MPYSAKIIKHLDELEPKVKRVIIELLDEIDKNVKESVKKEDFNNLQKAVSELTLTTQRLAEAQEKSEKLLHELIESQKQTDKRLESLVQRVEELSQAQKKTEEIVQQLVLDMDMVKKQLGGLSHAVGYGIEDRLIPFMDSFIQREFGFIPDEVERKYLQYENNKKDEVNIFIKGTKDNSTIIVIGECKSQPGKRDIDDFDGMIKRLSNYFKTEIYGFIVGYIFDPDVEKYINLHYPDIKYYKTYQVERIAKNKK